MEQRTNFLAMWSTVRIRSLRIPNSVGEGPIGLSSTSYALEEDDDECTYGITITKDDAPVIYTDHKLVFRALKGH